jgi:hypothetical protein
MVATHVLQASSIWNFAFAVQNIIEPSIVPGLAMHAESLAFVFLAPDQGLRFAALAATPADPNNGAGAVGYDNKCSCSWKNNMHFQRGETTALFLISATNKTPIFPKSTALLSPTHRS